MGSLRFPSLLEIYDRRRRNFSGDLDSLSLVCIGSLLSRRKFERGDGVACGFFGVGFRWRAGYKERFECAVAHGFEAGAVAVSPLARRPRRVDEFESSTADNADVLDARLSSSPNSNQFHNKAPENGAERKSKRRIWNRVADMNKAAARRGVNTPPASWKQQRSPAYARSSNKVEAALSAVTPDSSMEQCNSVLELLERSNSEQTMTFFEWMKGNEKLKQNDVAYQVALRALAKKDDWHAAEALLQEMAPDSDCERDTAAFNALIYVCARRELDEQGAKWFHVMLEYGAQPNATTIGLLMSLYQKRRNLLQAELTFRHMRSCKLKCVKAYSAMITIYVRSGMYDKSEEIIGMMEHDGVLPDLENWLARLNAYGQQGKLVEAESVLKSMKDAGVSPNIVAYNILITGYGKASQPKTAKCLLQSIQSNGLEPDETTYRSMIEGFGRSDDYKEALWYYKQLKKSGFQPNSSNFYTMINLQARHGDENGAAQTLEDMRARGCQHSSILSTLLHAYGKIGMIKKVPLILRGSFYENVLVDPTSCSILVMSYVQNFLVEDALRVLQDKRWRDSNFEDNLYHLLICSCKESGQYENAVKIYEQMQISDVNLNLHITCSMIDIYSALNRFTEAKKLYLKSKATGMTFDMIAYSIVVRMFVKSRSLKDACLVLDMMEKQEDIIPDKFLFLDMLRVYQQCGMLEKLTNVYNWILRSRVPLDEDMYNCVINCCGRALPVDELSRLFDNMIQHGYAANTNTYNVLLNVYGKAAMFKKVERVFWMARKYGVADVISYNTVIAAHGQSKKLTSMRYFVQKMQNAGYSISPEAYNCMLDAYGKEGLVEEFNDVLEKMKKASCASDHYTYNILINIYGKNGWIEEVARVLADLRDHGLEPDLYSYNTLIKAYGIAKMPEEAVNVVQEMRAKGVEPDRITYANLIVALLRNEDYLEAVKWSLWTKQTGISN